MTKCASEHVRAASHTEQLTATEWAEHLADAVKDLHSGDVTFPQSDVLADVGDNEPLAPERAHGDEGAAPESNSDDNPLRTDSE